MVCVGLRRPSNSAWVQFAPLLNSVLTASGIYKNRYWQEQRLEYNSPKKIFKKVATFIWP